MTRILHIIDHNGLGGAQRLVAGLLPHRPLDKIYPLRYIESGLFPWPDHHPYHPNENISNHLLHARSWQLSNIYYLPRWSKQNPFDIMHCHLSAGWIAGIWSKISLFNFRSFPIIFHEHNPYISTSWIYRQLAKLAGKFGNFVAVSQFIALILKEGGIPTNKITVLPNYVDNAYFFPEKPQERFHSLAGWCKDHTIVGFAGRLIKAKGWSSIIWIAELLRHEPIKFVIAGVGSDEQKIKHLIKQKKLEEKIRMLGFISDIRSFYRSLDILIFPSQHEPFGLVPIEAQACGIPVIAFDNPGVNEVISEQNSFLVPPGNDNQMAEKIKLLADDQVTRQRLIENGLKNVLNFSLEEYLTRLEEIYQSLLR